MEQATPVVDPDINQQAIGQKSKPTLNEDCPQHEGYDVLDGVEDLLAVNVTDASKRDNYAE
jgi:hypothetical protein